MKDHQSFFLAPDEPEPHCTTKSKKFKKTFLCSVARPRYNPKARSYFDGLIDIWPFVVAQVVQRSSRKTSRYLENESSQSSNKINKSCLRKKVFLVIRSKVPAQQDVPILGKQDDAGLHIAPHDTNVVNACSSSISSSPIKIVFQPANLKEFNAFGLGFFH